MHAIRNIELCTKDCRCLYICPTGATDTETGQIDADRCISGCRLCVDACPSHAISLAPSDYPEQQVKSYDVKKTLGVLSKSKTVQEKMAFNIMKGSDNPLVKQLARAIGTSNRIMAEDLLRESGFMLPQSNTALNLLKSLAETEESDDFPKDVVDKLIHLIE